MSALEPGTGNTVCVKDVWVWDKVGQEWALIWGWERPRAPETLGASPDWRIRGPWSKQSEHVPTGPFWPLKRRVRLLPSMLAMLMLSPSVQ